MQSDFYQYDALHARQIRLLEIVSSEIPTIRLRRVALDRAPIYEAVSYTWDGQTCEEPILCNGRYLLTTRNCIRLLQRLRTRPIKHLWIDAICIDQLSGNAKAEKGSQIPLMGEIYQRAARVLIWLGEATVASERAFELVNDVAAMMSKPGWYYFPSDGGPPQLPERSRAQIRERRAAFQAANMRMYGYEGVPESNMMSDVLNRSWFERSWTLQEIAVAKAATIMCGSAEMSWGHFSATIDQFSLEEYEASQEHINDTALRRKIGIHQRLRMTLKPTGVHINGEELIGPGKLFLLLETAHRLRASDPRDKVWALYGVLERMGITNLDRPNYNSSTEVQVFTDASIIALLHDQSLDILHSHGGTRITEALPSWVMDLSGASPPWSSMSHHRAARDSNPDFRIIDNIVLRVYGKRIDVIRERAHSRLPDENGDNARVAAGHRPLVSEVLRSMDQRVRTVREWALMAFQNASRFTPGSREQVKRAFRDTITQGGVVEGTQRYLTNDVLSTFEDWLDLLLPNNSELLGEASGRALAYLDDLVTQCLEIPIFCQLYLCGDVDPADVITDRSWRTSVALGRSKAALLAMRISLRTRDQTFFLTGKGHMGMATDLSQAGDVIALISGLTVPMIIRPCRGTRYEVIGPAYIEGTMQGESWLDGNPECIEFE